MDQNARQILMEILEIIDYQRDRNQFALEFLDLCCRKAIVSAVNALSFEEKRMLDESLKDNKDLDKSVESLQKIIGKDRYFKHLGKVSEKMFIDYIQTIMPTLSKEKQKELTDYLTTISVSGGVRPS